MKPRILIVDDDQTITQQLLWTLSAEYDVLIANDLRTAVRHVTIHEPTLSILDLHLPPELDSPNVGLRILAYIKNHLPRAKVLVVTASSGLEMRKACYAVGADEVLDKPFETEQLLSTMRRMVPRWLDVG